MTFFGSGKTRRDEATPGSAYYEESSTDEICLHCGMRYGVHFGRDCPEPKFEGRSQGFQGGIIMKCRICGEEVPDTATGMLDHLINHPNKYEDIYQRLRDYYNDLGD